MRRTLIAVAAVLMVLGGGPRLTAQAPQGMPLVEAVRSALLHLPYYGVFDFLAFSVDDDGAVRLTGYAFYATLKVDAERAVRQVAGVREVSNAIEVLPASSLDDNLRWNIFHAIYSDPFLSRYAPGGGIEWGHLHGVPGRPFGPEWRFPGYEPIGAYPIAIIVKGGRVTLMGVVDSESDRTLAEMRARNVWGALSVTNELVVEKRTT